MKYRVCYIILLLASCGLAQDQVTSEDRARLMGNWKGTITYLDYQTNEPFSMPVHLTVEQGKDAHLLLLHYSYPNKPKANSTDTMKIQENGTLIDGRNITSRTALENEQIQLKTQHKGQDGNKDALIQTTYLIGDRVFAVTKEVQFKGSSDWITRSEFKYRKENE